MVLDFSRGKSFLIRVIIYFAVIALVFRGLAYIAVEQLPNIFDSVLNSSSDGNFVIDLSGFNMESFSFDVVREWISKGYADFVSGILSVIFVGSEAKTGVTVGSLLPNIFK